jgi:DNA-binding HxlR family transcriptional regulator
VPSERYDCGLEAARHVISGKWKPPILLALHTSGPTRFGQLRRELEAVTEKVLSQQLKEMEGHGLVVRTSYDEAVPRVEYSLTPRGEQLLLALRGLSEWGDEHFGHLVEPAETTVRGA